MMNQGCLRLRSESEGFRGSGLCLTLVRPEILRSDVCLCGVSLVVLPLFSGLADDVRGPWPMAVQCKVGTRMTREMRRQNSPRSLRPTPSLTSISPTVAHRPVRLQAAGKQVEGGPELSAAGAAAAASIQLGARVHSCPCVAGSAGAGERRPPAESQGKEGSMAGCGVCEFERSAKIRLRALQKLCELPNSQVPNSELRSSLEDLGPSGPRDTTMPLPLGHCCHDPLLP